MSPTTLLKSAPNKKPGVAKVPLCRQFTLNLDDANPSFKQARRLSHVQREMKPATLISTPSIDLNGFESKLGGEENAPIS